MAWLSTAAVIFSLIWTFGGFVFFGLAVGLILLFGLNLKQFISAVYTEFINLLTIERESLRFISSLLPYFT